MRPEFRSKYVETDLFATLRDEVAWVNRKAPRDECFMAAPSAPRAYSYGNNNDRREALHTYHAVDMHPAVLALMDRINREFGTTYNVAVLNYYKDQHQHLGWHSDDSPEQDLSHPIAVVTFGAERYIYTKEKSFKGTIPEEDKFLLTQGSLFIMPGGYQDDHFHRIPKHDRECGGRISITFRKLDR